MRGAMVPLPRHVCHVHTDTLVIMPGDTWRGYLCSSRFCERAEIHVRRRARRNRGWNDILLVARENDCPRGCRRAGRNPGESNWLNAWLLLLDDGRTGMNVSAWWNITAFVENISWDIMRIAQRDGHLCGKQNDLNIISSEHTEQYILISKIFHHHLHKYRSLQTIDLFII